MDYSISDNENEREEWKEVFNETLLEEALQTLCAFLNSYGGKIIFGVNKNGVILKLSGDFDEMQQKIFNKTKSHLKPNAYEFFNVRVYDNRLYIFVKQSPSKIYQYRGVIYKRTGSSTHSLTFDETKKLEEQRKDHTNEIMPGVFKRITQGEVLRCENCGYSKVSGISISMSCGNPPQRKKCPKCGNVLTSNL